MRHHPAAPDRVLRLRFAADPASVPGARRFVADGLRAWGHTDLVDDATLCVSELAGNATLHGGGSYIEVGVLGRQSAVRVYVEDDGAVPADAVAPRTDFADVPGDDDLSAELALDDLDLELLDQPATGRGLAIVSVLANDWGVDELAHGKRVWAELGGPAEPGSGASTPTETPAHAAALPPGDQALPPGWTVVRLAACPVELSLRQDQHLDDLVRELTLIATDRDNATSADLARRLTAILHSPAHARLAGRRQAQEARRQGQDLVDIEMAMPREVSVDVRRLNEAVAEADVLCDEQRLLTLASPRAVRELRSWMTEQIVDQIEHGADPVPWEAWRAARR